MMQVMRTDFDDRLERIRAFREECIRQREEIVSASVHDIGFSFKDSTHEFEIIQERLESFPGSRSLLAHRLPICTDDEEVVVILPYNGSSWLNTAILSIFLVGNRVRVRFSSRNNLVAKLAESIYEKTVGPSVQFDYRKGAALMSYALESPKVKAIVVFGSDGWVLPYQVPVRNVRKTLVFEGPGNNPFIILNDARLSEAVRELALTKYRNSGQACVAPQRVYVQADVHDAFIDAFVEESKRFVVGPAEDPEADVTPIASPKVVTNIKCQLRDAKAKGAKIVYGGKVDDALVYPTIVDHANNDMLGMRCEAFGPVSYVSKFDTLERAIALARDNPYGLRASVFGGPEAQRMAGMLRGADYLEPVGAYTFGRFGTVSLNEPLSVSWKGALVTKPIGGYGYSGWVWDFPDGTFRLRQGPKLLSIETSREAPP
jgi:betaine-aldehyde dehydrogenase